MNYYVLMAALLLALVQEVYGFAYCGRPSTFCGTSSRTSVIKSGGCCSIVHGVKHILPVRVRRGSFAMKSGNSLTTTNVQLSNCAVTLRGLVMTDAIHTKLEDKIVDGVVSKLGDNIVTNTHITMSIDPKGQTCNVRCNMKGGAVVEAEEHTENMYNSIDLVSKTLSNNLKKYREKMKDKHQDKGKIGGTHTEDELDIINEV